jgi:putative transposase
MNKGYARGIPTGQSRIPSGGSRWIVKPTYKEGTKDPEYRPAPGWPSLHKTLVAVTSSLYILFRMHLEPISSLSWAYQLHYYFCFGTHRRRNLFSTRESVVTLSGLLEEICARHDYHLLRVKGYPDHLRCLLSLNPQQEISTVVRTIKANSSREFCSLQEIAAPAWARGFLAQSVGKARIEAVRNYLGQQPEHHGYSKRALPPVFRYSAPQPVRPRRRSFQL